MGRAAQPRTEDSVRVKVHIQHLDGTEEVTRTADDLRVVDGVLHVWDRHYNMGYSIGHEHIGSYPLTSIRKYWTEPA